MASNSDSGMLERPPTPTPPPKYSCYACCNLKLDEEREPYEVKGHTTSFRRSLCVIKRSADQDSCQSCSLLLRGMAFHTDLDSMDPSTKIQILYDYSDSQDTEPLKLSWDEEEPVKRRVHVGFYATEKEKLGTTLECLSNEANKIRNGVDTTNWTALTRKTNFFRSVSADSSSEECMKLLQNWVEECVQTHMGCRYEVSQLPKRVLSCGSVEENIRVVDSDGIVGKYMSLSHCWGQYPPPKMTKANMKMLKSGILFDQLPKTFKDAIIITRRLGIQYLWIDSLCIVQDDMSEFLEEIAKMGDIYARSFAVVAASDAKDCREGCFCPRPSERSLSNRLLSVEKDHKILEVYARLSMRRADIIWNSLPCRSPGSGRDKSLLETRGWTFQERLFAPRTLHFTNQELVFECRTHARCECRTEPRRRLRFKLLPSYDIQAASSEDVIDHDSKWAGIISNYTIRNLTFDSDRLRALSGAAAMMGLNSDEYVSGHWKNSLSSTLCWVVQRLNNKTPEDRVPRRHKECYAPSWSWPSVIGSVYFTTVGHDVNGQDCEPQHTQKILYVRVEGVSVVQNPVDPYEAPLSASIIARGRIACLKIVTIKPVDDPRGLKIVCTNEAGKSVLSCLDIHLDIARAPWEVSEGERVCLLLCAREKKRDTTIDSSMYKTDWWQFEGIVLRYAGQGEYGRVGHFAQSTQFNNTDEDDKARVRVWERFWFSETEERAVKIV